MVIKIKSIAFIGCVLLIIPAYSFATDGGVTVEAVTSLVDNGNNVQMVEDKAAEMPAEAQQMAELIHPSYMRELVPFETGRNDSNPVWSADGKKLAFERSSSGRKEIIVVEESGAIVSKVYVQPAAADELALLLPGLTDVVSYNAGISWSPDNSSYVFMSNGGEGNYDIYIGSSVSIDSERITDYEGKDGHAQWSPTGDKIVYVSGQSGSGDLFIYDTNTKATVQITQATTPFLYPEWSPTGEEIAVISGANENHDIYIVRNANTDKHRIVKLTDSTADDLRPTWSPDGKRIAFYTNMNDMDDPKIWSIAVIDIEQQNVVTNESLLKSIVIQNVVPDIERGPAWLPDSKRLAYVLNSKQEYNPIYITNVTDGHTAKLGTDTRMNHDVACASTGEIAFRAQVDQWDQIYVARLP